MTLPSEKENIMKKAELERRLAELKTMLDTAEGSQTEVYSRIVGYYRSVRNWNAGKRHEYTRRKMYNLSAHDTVKAIWSGSTAVAELPGSAKPEEISLKQTKPEQKDLFSGARYGNVPDTGTIAKYMLFVKPNCPNCPPVKKYLADLSLEANIIDVSTDDGFELARRYNVLATPTVVFYTGSGIEAGRAFSKKEAEQYIKTLA